MRTRHPLGSVGHSAVVECLEGRALLSMAWEGTWNVRGIGYEVEESSPSGRFVRNSQAMTAVITFISGDQYQLNIAATPGMEAFQANMTMSSDGNSLGMADVGGERDQYLEFAKLSDNAVAVFESSIEFDSVARDNIRAGEGFGGMATRAGTPSSFGTFSFAGTRTFSIGSVESRFGATGAGSSISHMSGKVVITALADGKYRVVPPDGPAQTFSRDGSTRLVQTQTTQESSGTWVKRGVTVMLGPDGRLIFVSAYGAYNSSSTRKDRQGTVLGLGHVLEADFDAGYSNPANFAPVLKTTGSLHMNTISEDDRTNTGTAIKDLVASAGIDSITDQNTSGKEGIALIGKNTTIGSWQYSWDGGVTWLAVPAVSNSSALLLAADAGGLTRLRLVPKSNYFGAAAAALTFRAWDQSRGGNGKLLSAATTGGATAFSTVSKTASIRVVAAGDAPVLTGMPAATTPRFVEGGAPVYVMPSVVVSDVDSVNISGATVWFSDAWAGSQDQLLFSNTSAITGSYDYGTGTLTLSGVASKAAYQAALRSIRYRNVSQDPETDADLLTSDRIISATVRDAALTSTAKNQGLRVTEVNDAPVAAAGSITLQGATLGDALVVDFTELADAIMAVAPYSDVDNAEDELGFRLTAVSGTLSKGGVAGATILMLPSDTDDVTWTPSTTGTIKAFTVRIWDGALASVGVIDVFVEVS